MHKGKSITPESMQAELSAWNNGKGIDLESWIGCSGNFSLAVGYTTLFWPEFVQFEGYILRKGFSVEALRGFEIQNESTPIAIEWVMNHMHLDSIHHTGCEDIAKDKIMLLGNIMKEIYQAKLGWQFPDKPCTVELYIPELQDDLGDYQISFWQTKNGGAGSE